MTFDIFLAKPQREVPRGQQEKTSLVVIVSHRNVKYRKNIGITLYPYQFTKGHASDWRQDAKIRSIRAYLYEELVDTLTPDEIQERLVDARRMVIEGLDAESLRRKKEKERKDATTAISLLRGTADPGRAPTFSEYLQTWWPLGGTSKRQRKLFCDNIAKFFGKNIQWDEIDDSFRFSLERKMDAAGFAMNYKWKMVSQLKTVMEEGRKLKYHNKLDYKDWTAKRETVETIYLTQEELDRIWEVELTSTMERKARDLFFIGVYTVARFSDYSRISDDIIHDDGLFHLIHKKTGAVVNIPVAPRVREVLDRNGGRAPELSQQKFNDAIKQVCKKAGINEIIETRHSRGREFVTERKEKWELVSSHTARRTGATLMRQSGANMRQIMLIGGWSEEKTLEKYLRMTSKENALAMRDNPFFN